MKSRSLPLILGLLLFLSAIALIISQYKARKLFIELGVAQTQKRQLEVETTQLQLKQSTLSKHARVEENAQSKLGMSRVEPSQMKFIKVAQR